MNHVEKVAIVTGAGQGIGLEICRMLAQRGTKVILNDLDGRLAEKGAEGIRRENSVCVAVAGDSSDPALVDELVDTAVSQFGRLDIVIANAGITLYGDFFSYKAEDLQRVMQVNVLGTFLLAQAGANQMKKQFAGSSLSGGSLLGGSLLFTSSVTGHQAHRNLAAYGMSKAAIEMLARNLVVELSPFHINVNAIAPGATVTERTVSDDPDYIAKWSRLTPMGRPATVSDIAQAALFLVSDEARHITGQTLVVDGGWTCASPLE